MRKTLFIFLLVGFLFLIEFILFNLFGSTWVPNLLLIFIVFVDLYFGIRFGILSAVLSGVIKDSFSVSFFGIHLVTFLLIAYLVIVLKKYVYLNGSRFSRLLLVALISLIYVVVEYIFQLMFQSISFPVALIRIMLPQVVVNVFVTMFMFEQFKKCALKFSV